MIAVTERASEALKHILEASATEPSQGLRLMQGEDGRFGLVLDQEQPDDQIIESQGTKVLFIASVLSDNIDATVDFEETPEGARLTIS